MKDADWGLFLDMWLGGKGLREIMAATGAADMTVRTVIFNRIPANYDRHGTRESAISRLAKASGKRTLDPDRAPTARDADYFRLLKRAGRTAEECAAALHLSADGMAKIASTFGAPRRRGFQLKPQAKGKAT